jgi:hypothetical protein
MIFQFYRDGSYIRWTHSFVNAVVFDQSVLEAFASLLQDWEFKN